MTGNQFFHCLSVSLPCTLGLCKSARWVRILLSENVPQCYSIIVIYFRLLTAEARWWCAMYFLSICTVAVALISISVSMPVSEKRSGMVQRAPSNLTAGLSIEHVGAGDQESDTTFWHLEWRLILSDGLQDSRLWHLFITVAWKRAARGPPGMWR